MRRVAFGFLILCSSILAGCGGAGGGGSTNALPTTGGTAPVPTTPVPSMNISGKVVQMTGPLSSSVWNIAAPSNCAPAVQNVPCGTYPTPIPSALLPGPAATPGIGSGVQGATVYVTSVAGAIVNGIPPSPIATASTGADGSFSITLPAATNSQVGLVAVYGSVISAYTGTTNLGYTVAHADAVAGAPATLFIDSLSGDEQSGFESLNAALVAAGDQPVVADTVTQAAARLTRALGGLDGSGYYEAFGGASQVSLSGVASFDGAYWGAGYQWTASPFPTPAPVFAGLAAIYNPPHSTNSGNSFTAIFALP